MTRADDRAAPRTRARRRRRPPAPRRRPRPGPRADPGHRARSSPGAARARRRGRDRRTGPAEGVRAPTPTTATRSCSTPPSAGWSPTTAGTSTCGCTASSAAGPSWSAPRSPHTARPSVRRRHARRPHRLDRLGDPAEAARPDRRTPAQRGARPRHGDRDRGARPAPADGRRARGRSATAAVRATPTADRRQRDATSRSEGLADVWGLSRPPVGPLRRPFTGRSGAISSTDHPRAGDGDVECGPQRGIMGVGSRASAGRDPCRVSGRSRRGARERGPDRRDRRQQPAAPSERRELAADPQPTSTATTTPRRSRSSRASRRSASGRACTSARPASAACTT